MKTTYQLFKKYLDEFEKTGRFLTSTTIVDNHGSLLLKYHDNIMCDTSQCGNLVNPYQCNDMMFLRYAIEIVRMSLDVVFKKKYSKSNLKSIIENISDINQYPITPGKWSVMFEYNGYHQLNGDVNSAEICHNRCNDTGYLYWIFAQCPDLYKQLNRICYYPDDNKARRTLKFIVNELLDDYNRYFVEEK